MRLWVRWGVNCRQRIDEETRKVEGKLSVEPFDQITALTASKWVVYTVGKELGTIQPSIPPSTS